MLGGKHVVERSYALAWSLIWCIACGFLGFFLATKFVTGALIVVGLMVLLVIFAANKG